MKVFSFFILTFIIFFSISQNLFSQNYWSRLNGPYGGSVLEVKKHQGGNLYALRGEDLYVSTNSGDSWNGVGGTLANTNLSMDISPSGAIYVGKSSGGLWWTSNAGQSWSFNPIHIAPHSGLWASVLITKINPFGNIFINSHVSFNGGPTFIMFTDNTIGVSSDYAFNSSNHVYSASYNGIFYSVDNGTSWTNINGNLPSVNASSLMFDNNILFAGINGSGIFKTTDNGITWTALNNGLTSWDISRLHRYAQNVYYAGTFSGSVFKSTDGGALWNEIFRSSVNTSVNSVYTEGNTIFVSTSLGIFKSTDSGVTWTEKNTDLFLTGINSLEFSNTNEIFAAANAGFFYSSDNGQIWERRGTSLPSSIINTIFYTDNNVLLAGVFNRGAYRSFNKGLSWQSSNTGIDVGDNIKQIKRSSNGFIFAAALRGTFADTVKIYRSSDNGGSWIKVLQPARPGLTEFTIDDTGILYVAGTDFMFQSAVLKSTDNGSTWTENLIPNFFTAIDNLASYGSDLYMSSSLNIYKSTDAGQSWNQLNGGGWTSAPQDLEINSAGKIFLSNGNMVYVSTNEGASWTQENSGLPSNTSINNLVLDKEEFIYGITYYYGIFKSVRSTLTSTGNNAAYIVPDYKLEQNYPNPFNPSTKISYELPIANFVTLKVFDLTGKEVMTLVKENQNSGSHEVIFNGANLPSGVYYYKLKAENFENVKKMILLK